jgi:hypothetical protein
VVPRVTGLPVEEVEAVLVECEGDGVTGRDVASRRSVDFEDVGTGSTLEEQAVVDVRESGRGECRDGVSSALAESRSRRWDAWGRTSTRSGTGGMADRAAVGT